VKSGTFSRALGSVWRWLLWWLATGLIAMGVGLAILNWPTLVGAPLAVFLLPGLILAGLLWRWRSDTDGAAATAVLSTGFWLSLWVLVWADL
jgi:hypothetical protein